VFGEARTQEADPELAIRAAIGMQRNAEDVGLQVAVGINTGEVVVGGIDGETGVPFTLVSTVVDLSADLAARAERGQILVGETTYTFTREAFQFTRLAANVRGATQNVSAYRVDGLLREPRKARGIEGLRAELIGRDNELARLTEVLAEALHGRGQMVSIIGQAGVGKSRLVAELRKCARGGGGAEPLWLEGRCLGLGTAVSYAPFSDILRAYFAWGAREADRRRYERITSSLEDMVSRGDLAEGPVEDMAALLANLLSIRSGAERQEQLQNEDPEHVRWRTFAAVRDFFAALSRQQPVVLVFEDLHWADSLSLDLISLLMESLSSFALLLVCVYRPEQEHRCWHLGTVAGQKCRERYTELHVRELGRTHSQRLAKSLLGTPDLPPEVEDLTLARGQGNPFFIEEVVRSLIDAGVLTLEGGGWQSRGTVKTVGIPESVQSVILSRVDLLEEGWRHVLEVASVIGRVFPRRVLAQAIRPDVDLEQALWALEGRELIYQERTIPEVEYSFKHVLAQETVYHGLVRSRREALHRRVAAGMEALYADNLDEVCERLAHHYERGQDVERAIGYMIRAGEKARSRFANEEAIAHLSRGLSLLRDLPATPERDRQEIELRLALGIALVHSRGHAAPEVEGVYSRARDLSERVGGGPCLIQALVGLRRFRLMRGELLAAYELGERALTLSQEAQDALHLSFVHMLHAETLYWLGAFARARAHCDRGLACFDPQQRRSYAVQYGNEPEVGLGIYEALSLWHLGFPDRAVRRMRRTLGLAEELSQPFSLAFALSFAATLHDLCGEVQAALDLTEALMRVSTEHGYALYSTAGAVLQGLLLSEQSSAEEWVGRIRMGIADWEAIGGGMWLTTWLARLAQAYGRMGRVEEGLQVSSEGLARADATGERCWEAELHRLKGELLRMKGTEGPRAEACFRRALDVAREQGAKSWELRAATSLSRLWQDQGKTERARRQLRDVYGWFTEGFDTADLREAWALLDALEC
jgi:class 3 adenylate cyclase